ncbi:MAG: Rab family GTPase, partial [Promethearchaeota archaeon]
ITTIGINYLTKEIDMEKKDFAKLVIWDIAGQKKFKFLHKQYYEGTQGALVIFDLTQTQTYEALEIWISELFSLVQKKIPIIIIGNKVDLIEEVGRSIKFDIVKEYADNKNSIYIETSAKTGENVEEAFRELTHRMIVRANDRIKDL